MPRSESQFGAAASPRDANLDRQAAGAPSPAEGPASGVPPRQSAASLAARFDSLLNALDDDRFELREEAIKKLDALVGECLAGDAALARDLAALVQGALLRIDLSYEVRWQLERAARRLPAVAGPPAALLDDAALDRLVATLDADAYSARLGAARQLHRLLQDPVCALRIVQRVKRQLDEASAVVAPTGAAADERDKDREAHGGPARRSSTAEKGLSAIYEAARGVWLQSDPAAWQLPPLDDVRLAAWIDVLARPGQPQTAAATAALATAERELRDALASDADVPRIKTALENRGSAISDPDAAARFTRLIELTRPALVAEFWERRHHRGEQHLLVGVPSQAPNAARPSHFDYIDDVRAHCVSGNSLLPGDYPVGVAFPHPLAETAFFQLVNLPTPRRRMAYDYLRETDDAERLAAISRRTLDRFTAAKQPLNEAELTMLMLLDPKEVSRFAAGYFRWCEDTPLATGGRNFIGGRPTSLGMLCAVLAIDGTNDAVPGITDAIARGRFLPPTPLAPVRMQWVAALAIAKRDPWPQLDDWLAARVSNRERLIVGEQAAAAEVGATAAAMLLRRRHAAEADFGLMAAPDPLIGQYGVDGYQFSNDQGPQRVRRWWEAQQSLRQQP